MSKELGRTELSDLGEFGLIKKLSEKVKISNESTVLGIGDDAAVLRFPNSEVLVTTDMLVEKVHFDLMYTPLKHLGYKAVVVNLSDIYAMNGRPEQVFVSIALSNRFSLEAVEEVYKGIQLACERYKVDLAGGDTSSSPQGLIISITATGSVEKDRVCLRSGAKENDLLCVSGNLGGAYMGLQVLEREKKVFEENPKIQPDLSGFDYILERQLKPEARNEIIDAFRIKDIIPTSMIDVSDGLASELIHLCQSSKKGCAVYEEKIPIDVETAMTAEKFKMEPTICALSGGEDYELLFTADIGDYNKIKELQGVTIIGHITDQGSGMNLITQSGSQVEITAQGWDAFLGK